MDEPSRDVVILGAGFSKAVHEAFPVLSELAERVLPLLEDRAAPSTRPLVDELRRAIEASKEGNGDEHGRPSVDFEGWLSRIAVDQPHLNLVENYERRALFANAATAIRQVLLEAQKQALSDDGVLPCTWSYELLRLLDVRRTTVITMNYDTIVERLAPLALWPWRVSQRQLAAGAAFPLFAADLFADLPPTIPAPPGTIQTLSRGPKHEIPRAAPDTFNLLKLHGSLDWFAARGDPSGATLVRWERSPDASDGDSWDHHPVGREPFLIPPDANKSAYFDNPIVRELWSRARTALEQAASVTLVGYSLPATDTTFGGLLADTIGPRTHVPLTVVDRKPDPVVTRLRMLGISETRIMPRCGDGAIRSWVEATLGEQARLTAQRLHDLRNEPGVHDASWNVTVEVAPPHKYVGWSFRHVTSASLREDRTHVLTLQPWTQLSVPEARALIDFLPPPQAETVTVELEHGCREIIAFHLVKPGPREQLSELVLQAATTPADWL